MTTALQLGKSKPLTAAHREDVPDPGHGTLYLMMASLNRIGGYPRMPTLDRTCRSVVRAVMGYRSLRALQRSFFYGG
jgi:hypothetical protein